VRARDDSRGRCGGLRRSVVEWEKRLRAHEGPDLMPRPGQKTSQENREDGPAKPIADS
jgi:hypothetical protein